MKSIKSLKFVLHIYYYLSHGDGKRYFAINQINIRVSDRVLFWIVDSSFEEWIIETIIFFINSPLGGTRWVFLLWWYGKRLD